MQNLLCLADAGLKHGVVNKLVDGVQSYGSFAVYEANELWQPTRRVALERASWLPYCEKFATSPFLAESCNLLSLLAWLKERKWFRPNVRIHILTDSSFLAEKCFETYKEGPQSTLKLCAHLRTVLAECMHNCPVSLIWIPGDLMKKTIIRH